MKISASIYAYNDSSPREEVIKSLDQLYIDSFHIDCKDDMSVFDDIAAIRSISNTPIDLHIISSTPEKYFEKIEQYGVEYVQFQYENIKSHPIEVPDNGVTKWGLGMCSNTPIDVFEQYRNFDFVLFMTTVPGESGGKFDKVNFQRIRSFRNRYQNKKIFVDGGVNGEVAFILRNMGVSSVVCGSFLANNLSAGKALLDLRVNNVESRYLIGDFMNDEIPLLSIDECTVTDILATIENYKMGYVIFKGADGKIAGLASNADVRRAFLAKSADFASVRVEDFVNTNPFVLSSDTSISQMFKAIEKQDFIVNFVPVIDADGAPVGVVNFYNLIRSEI
ncbi:MAG: CBS domain-containing protein [bacterium]